MAKDYTIKTPVLSYDSREISIPKKQKDIPIETNATPEQKARFEMTKQAMFYSMLAQNKTEIKDYNKREMNEIIEAVESRKWVQATSRLFMAHIRLMAKKIRAKRGLISKLKKTKNYYSNCCGEQMEVDEHLCPGCKEPCDKEIRYESN